MGMKPAPLSLAVALCLGASAPVAAKDALFTCRNLVGVSYAVRTGRPDHNDKSAVAADDISGRVIVVELTDRQGQPFARLRYRDRGGALVDPRDLGAIVHVRYGALDRRKLLIDAEYQSIREAYVFTRDSRGASLRLSRTQFVFNGWLSSTYSGDCAVG
jgi:hypothetical protein